jgi:hypothetical protein
MAERLLSLMGELCALLRHTKLSEKIRVLTEEISGLLEQHKDKPSSSTALAAPSTPQQAHLPLGPLALQSPTPRGQTYEQLVAIGHNLGIPDYYVREWYAKQEALEWLDFKGRPIQHRARFLIKSWETESRNRDRHRARSSDKPVAFYADYARNGPNQEPEYLPIPKATEQDWDEAGKIAKQMMAEFRRKSA